MAEEPAVFGIGAAWKKTAAWKNKTGARAAKNMKLLYRLLKAKGNCTFDTKIVSLNTNILLVLYFLQFYISSLWEKNFTAT